MIKIVIYKTDSGKKPYVEWFRSLDGAMKVIITKRLDRVKVGNFGATKPVRQGVKELIFDIGPGYRIYYGLQDNTVVLLLMAGDKSTQKRDIEKAKEYWDDAQGNDYD